QCACQPGRGVSETSQDQPQRLCSHETAYDSRKSPEHTRLSAAGYGAGWGRGREEAAVARVRPAYQHADLSLEPREGSVDEWPACEDTGVVDQVAGREVVAAVEDDVVTADDLEG